MDFGYNIHHHSISHAQTCVLTVLHVEYGGLPMRASRNKRVLGSFWERPNTFHGGKLQGTIRRLKIKGEEKIVVAWHQCLAATRHHFSLPSKWFDRNN